MSNEFRDFMIEWNLKFPIDKWYREKYKIPFMSKQHRESSFLNIRLEWEEERLFHSLQEESQDLYEANQGDFLKQRKTPISFEDRATIAAEFLKKMKEASDGQ